MVIAYIGQLNCLLEAFGKFNIIVHVIYLPDEAALLTVEGERLADKGEGGELRGDHRGGDQGPDQEHAGRVCRYRLKVRS